MGVIPNMHMPSLTIPFRSSHPPAISFTPTTLKPSRKSNFVCPKAADEKPTTTTAEDVETNPDGDVDFEEKLARIRRKVRSGSGKKAELRKMKKAGMDSSKLKPKKKGILLPPIPLKDPVSGGLKVELGFNSYSERLNGIFAAFGLAALLLVELGSGQSLIKYHAPGTVILQTYFMLAVSALFIKYQKEKISVWPKDKS